MPTRVGSSKRYTEEEKRATVLAAKKHESFIEASRALSVSAPTLRRWGCRGKDFKKMRLKKAKKQRENLAKKSLKYASKTKAIEKLGISFNALLRYQKECGVFEKLKASARAKEKELLNNSVKYKSVAEASRALGSDQTVITRLQKEAGCHKLAVRQYSPQEKRMYSEESRKYDTLLEASHYLNIPYGNLGRWRRSFGIYASPQHKNRRSEEEQLRLAEASIEYSNLGEASRRLCVGGKSLRMYCKKFGIPIKRGRRIYTIEEKIDIAKKIRDGYKMIKIIRQLKIPRTNLNRWIALYREGKL